MRFLHTSDWHLGHVLTSRKRYDEFQHFLEWLAKTINDEAMQPYMAGQISQQEAFNRGEKPLRPDLAQVPLFSLKFEF